jgi:hypothetical protein
MEASGTAALSDDAGLPDQKRTQCDFEGTRYDVAEWMDDRCFTCECAWTGKWVNCKYRRRKGCDICFVEGRVYKRGEHFRVGLSPCVCMGRKGVTCATI